MYTIYFIFTIDKTFINVFVIYFALMPLGIFIASFLYIFNIYIYIYIFFLYVFVFCNYLSIYIHHKRDPSIEKPSS